MLSQIGGLFNTLTPNDLFNIFVILLVALLLFRLNKLLIPWIAEKLAGKRRLQVLAFMPIIRLIIIISTFLILFPKIIVPTPENLLAFLGAMGIALGFALKEYISSLIAGIVTLYEMPYRPGDWIEINGVYGEVKSIGLRSLEIITPDDTVVRIPQLKMLDSPLFNSTAGSRELLCVIDFFLHPEHDPNLVKRLLYDVAFTSAFIQIKKPVIIIIFEKPWGTNYKVKAYPLDARNQFQFITDITVRGKQALIQNKIQYAHIPISSSEKA